MSSLMIRLRTASLLLLRVFFTAFWLGWLSAGCTSQPVVAADSAGPTFTHGLLAREHWAQNGGVSTLTEEQRAQVRLLDELVHISVTRVARLPISTSPRTDAIATCRVINQVLIEHGYKLKIPTDLISNALTPGLKEGDTSGSSRTFDCDTGSFIYLAVFETLKQPACLVEIPSHNFVRLKLRDGTTFNWDVNDAETYTNDQFRQGDPRTSSPFSRATEAQGHFLADMTPAETQAYHTGLIGSVLRKAGRADLAFAELQAAVAARPYAAGLRNNAAWDVAVALSLQTPANLDLALQFARSAVAQMPHDNNYIDTLAAVHAARREFDQAIEVEKTGNNDPQRIQAYRDKKNPADLGWD